MYVTFMISIFSSKLLLLDDMNQNSYTNNYLGGREEKKEQIDELK